MATKIEWAESTWNPITGCTKVSEGCMNCYAERMAKRLAGRCGYDKDKPFKLTMHHNRMNEPMRWRKPRKVFVCSMGDLFHEQIAVEVIEDVFDVMRCCKQHTFMVLTKRTERMANFLAARPGLPGNIWLGTTVEHQAVVDERLSNLVRCDAAVLFASCEPLLGALNLEPYMLSSYDKAAHDNQMTGRECRTNKLQWVICGGETGPGARPMQEAWAVDLLEQCDRWEVPFFFKKWGNNKKREIYGQVMEQWPTQEIAQ